MADKREKIALFLDAAARAFTQHAYTDVSVADLARDAGMSTATVFAVFKSKDGVFDAAMRGFVSKRLNGIEEPDAAAPPVERFLNWLSARAAVMSDPAMRRVYQMFIANTTLLADEFFAGWKRRVDANTAIAAALCAELQGAGLMTAGDAVSIAKSILARLNHETALFGALVRDEHMPDPEAPDSVARSCLDLFLTGAGIGEAQAWTDRRAAATRTA